MFVHEGAASNKKHSDARSDKVMIAKIASKLEEMDKRLASMGMQDGEKARKGIREYMTLTMTLKR